MNPIREPAGARSTIYVWAALVAMTLLSFTVFETDGFREMHRAAVAIIMASSGIKAYLVFRYFMGVGATPRSYRLTFLAWILFCVTLVTSAGIIGS